MLKPTVTMPERRTGTQPLTSLMKGLQVLVFLRDSAKPLSLTAISRGLGFNKVSALRILLTLERHRFVEKDPHDKTYKIGSNNSSPPRPFALATNSSSSRRHSDRLKYRGVIIGIKNTA